MIEAIFIFIFGTVIGSFLNAFIWRLSVEESVLKGRSHCVHCSHDLSAGDLIPIVSFLLLKGKCRYCKKSISWQYPLVEIATGVLFVCAYTVFIQAVPTGLLFALASGEHARELLILARDLFFISALMVLFVYDVRWYLLPDVVTIPAIVIALALNLMLGMDFLNLLLAAVVGGGFFLAQYVVSRGTWIGGGDIRLGALMGVMLGWPAVLYALFIAYIGGAIISIFLLALKKKGMKSEIPFGPFLCAATMYMLLYGNTIIQWFTKNLAL